MVKLVRRIFLLFMLIVVLAAVSVLALIYSDELATDVAHLECPLVKAEGGEMTFDDAVRIFGPVSYARLRRDWINQRIVVHFIDDTDSSENGLSDAIYLTISTLEYSGYDYADKRQRRFDRESLVYRAEHRESYNSSPDWYFERACRLISEDIFEKRRARHAYITRAKQKI